VWPIYSAASDYRVCVCRLPSAECRVTARLHMQEVISWGGRPVDMTQCSTLSGKYSKHGSTHAVYYYPSCMHWEIKQIAVDLDVLYSRFVLIWL
jgi:hypothetical protein